MSGYEEEPSPGSGGAVTFSASVKRDDEGGRLSGSERSGSERDGALMMDGSRRSNPQSEDDQATVAAPPPSRKVMPVRASTPAEDIMFEAPTPVRQSNTKQQLEDWFMDVKHLKLGAELGRGNFGIVRQAMWRSTPCAVKVLFNVQYAESKELFAKELSTMRQLHHPNIVQFLGFALLPEPGIVMELFPNLSVEDYIKNVKWIRYRTARRFASEMGNAVAYLHGRHPHHFIHRDIKPSNFMLTNSLRVKLGDFGIARMFDDESMNTSGAGSMNSSMRGGAFDQTANCGTVRYMAPEVRGTGPDMVAKYSTSADIWSLGLSIYFIFEFKPPAIQGANNPPAHFNALAHGERPMMSKSPPGVREIISACWNDDPTFRPNADQLVRAVEGLPLAKRAPPLCCLTDNAVMY